jgi:hypothetical protein
MKRSGLILTSLVATFLTGIVVRHSGSCGSPSHRSALQHGRLPSSYAKAQDPWASETARRWRQGQPVHWRAYLLNK